MGKRKCPSFFLCGQKNRKSSFHQKTNGTFLRHCHESAQCLEGIITRLSVYFCNITISQGKILLRIFVCGLLCMAATSKEKTKA